MDKNAADLELFGEVPYFRNIFFNYLYLNKKSKSQTPSSTGSNFLLPGNNQMKRKTSSGPNFLSFQSDVLKSESPPYRRDGLKAFSRETNTFTPLTLSLDSCKLPA